MTQFSSGKHAKLTADPQPFIFDAGIVLGEFRVSKLGADSEFGEHRFDPRPEFDRQPRSRVTKAGENSYWGDSWDTTMDWLDWATEADAFCRTEWITNQHLTRARAVLSRLAALQADA